MDSIGRAHAMRPYPMESIESGAIDSSQKFHHNWGTLWGLAKSEIFRPIEFYGIYPPLCKPTQQL
jgi:hypothetical protein